ncbi:hypothetical protein ADK52_11675 [Streptomyces sp. WM6372]|uniref:hypothetical protein n=1 Tax=Streptomyces sp. WM6372 TaxID=1415555 RepID=UPI0006C71D50|nr:hypothetical protein [Streptomyces sp. WM6372]KOU25681.1 hypothetical protein ADK52_11675 [Streptomyces sp. WM6372]
MSGPTVVIERLSATLRHAPGAPPPAADRLRGPLRRAVDGPLEAALRALDLPPGHWCLARLDLSLGLDLDRPDPALARDWSEAVAAAIERTVREGRAGAPGALVHYRHDVELLADAVAGLAAGRRERLWAWRQTGVLRPGDPAPEASPGPALLAALERRPEQAAAAVLRGAERCGLAALDRAWGRDGWQCLAALVAGTDRPAPGEPPAAPPPGPDARALARTLLAGSRLVRLVRASRLRPAGPVLAAWAVLVLAETDPAALERPAARPGLRGLLAEGLRALGAGAARPETEAASTFRESPDGGHRADGADPGDTEPAGAVAAADGAEAPPGGDAPPQRPPAAGPPRNGAGGRGPGPGGPSAGDTAAPAPVRPVGAEPAPDPADGAATGWAGLLFLLATAPETGLPDRALDEPALAARPLPWVLHAAARALVPGIAPGDPAALALAGLAPDRATALLRAPAATPREQDAVDALAAGWAGATAARLGDERYARDPFGAVLAVARRPGRITAETGWIEAVLAVADTDLAVRRAGLDLDPGWLGWLGAVVRYRYV